MNFADIVVVAILIAILVAIVYFTRSKKGEDNGCAGCHGSCSSCSSFSSLFEDYKKDHPDDESLQ